MPGPVRKRRKKRDEGPPFWLFLCVAVCLLVLILIPLAHKYRWFQPPRAPAPAPAVAKVAPAPEPASKEPADLSLSELRPSGEGPKRWLEGQVRNNSASPYKDVRVVMSIRSRAGAIIGAVTGEIPSLAPGSTAAFRTGELPKDTFRFTLREITGTRK